MGSGYEEVVLTGRIGRQIPSAADDESLACSRLSWSEFDGCDRLRWCPDDGDARGDCERRQSRTLLLLICILGSLDGLVDFHLLANKPSVTSPALRLVQPEDDKAAAG